MRRRRKLSLRERRRRALRNERRGRAAGPRPREDGERARLFRFGGVALRLYRGRLEPVRFGPIAVPARSGAWPRALGTLARLPRPLRREITEARVDAKEREREDRLREQGVEILRNEPVWGQATKAAP